MCSSAITTYIKIVYISSTPEGSLFSLPVSGAYFHGEQCSDICQNQLFYLLNIIGETMQYIFFGGWTSLAGHSVWDSCGVIASSTGSLWMSILLYKLTLQLKVFLFWNNFKLIVKLQEWYSRLLYTLCLYSPYLSYGISCTIFVLWHMLYLVVFSL